MGLFSKKPKSIIVPLPDHKGASGDEAMDRLGELLPMVETLPPPPKFDPPAKAAKPAKPPKPPKQNRKATVDPTDFLALRSELKDMRARLDESEHARAIVEARLSSLDAAASAFATERNDITEVANMVVQLQQQVAERTNENGSSGSSSPAAGVNDELSAKVDALQNRLFGLQDHAPKIAEFESQLAQLRTELETATAAAAEAAVLPPPPPSTNGPDPETLERIAAVQQRVNDLDQIRHRLGEIDHFKQRMGEIDLLHQRVAGVEAMQERVGDRVGQLTEQPRGADDDIRLQLQEIDERLRNSEELQAQVAQLLERAGSNDTEARAVREHMALLDQRLTNVSTELANQLSELGRDIDGLDQRASEVADGVVSDEVVDALRGGQVKLANEQARYEIAFREDLAALAEQLRRGRTQS